MTIDLYIGRVSTPSTFVCMVAKHIGVDLNIQVLNTSRKEHLKPEFLKTPAFNKSKFPKLSSHHDRVSSLLPYYEETNKVLLERITGWYNAAK